MRQKIGQKGQKAISKRETGYREVVGDVLKAVRTMRKMSQGDLSRVLGRSQNFVHTLETGKTDVGIVLLIRLCEALDVGVYQVVELMHKRLAGDVFVDGLVTWVMGLGRFEGVKKGR